MALDTAVKRAAALWDSIPTPYPSGDISIGDRAFFAGLWYFYDVPLSQQSYLARINTILLDALDTIGDTQQEDLSKASFPLYNLYLNPNESLTKPNTHLDINSYRFTAFWEIHCFNKTTDQSDSRFAHNLVLFDMLKDVKTLLGTNILYDICEEVKYLGCTIVKLADGANIVCPQKLVIRLQTTYSQQRLFPRLGLEETC